MKTYEPTVVEHIMTTAWAMVGTAKAQQQTITVNVNGVELTAEPNSDPDDIVRFYHKALSTKSDARV